MNYTVHTVNAILIGAGQRGAQVYGAFARRNPKDIRFVAAAPSSAVTTGSLRKMRRRTGANCSPVPNWQTALSSARRTISTSPPRWLRWMQDIMW